MFSMRPLARGLQSPAPQWPLRSAARLLSGRASASPAAAPAAYSPAPIPRRLSQASARPPFSQARAAAPRPRTPRTPLCRPPTLDPRQPFAFFSSSAARRILDPRDPRVQAAMRNARPIMSRNQAMRIAKSPSTHAIVVLCIAGGLIFYYSNIETVPVSGRRRFNCYSEEWIKRASETEYKQLLAEIQRSGVHVLPASDWRARAVRRVMARLIPVSGVHDVEWEVFVVDEPGTANAFVLPNGKVFVYSGLFRPARTDDALAAVLGHEIAHNLAGHVSEKLSQGIGISILYYSTMLLAYTVGAAFLMEFFGGGRLVRTLLESPMSRMQESEADYIGLMMMAEACYNPREAVQFWKRMQAADIPEWLSTHPSNETRIEKIMTWMPVAEEKRMESDCQGTQSFADLFRRAMQEGQIITVW